MLNINQGWRKQAYSYATSGSINWSATSEDDLAELLKFKMHLPSSSTFG